jgi:WD40 repeat protein
MGWSPDGTKLAAFSKDGTIHICDPRSDRPLHRMDFSKEDFYSSDMDWSADGRRFAATASKNDFPYTYPRFQPANPEVVIWDTGTWQIVRKVQGNAAFSGAAFSPDGKTLAIGSDDGTIWHIES